MTKYSEILQSRHSVFTLDDLSVLWGQSKRSDTRQSARNYATQGKLFRIKRGIYSIRREPDIFAIANKLVVPSYITGFTVLIREGLSFQASDTIHNASIHSRKMKLGEVSFYYNKMSDKLFYNKTGIREESGTFFASVERAICDMLYFNVRPQIDFYDKVDWEKLLEIAKIYGNKSVFARAQKMKDGYDGR
ncbi:MAG: hypothetical protein LBM97_01615 [Candidatus Nomurabacteria bacterium]|jgi:predicted transcriptional regulator of viral defense system|nr:hypothetical protein [Candidatus Nomurabacteria bacterium]